MAERAGLVPGPSTLLLKTCQTCFNAKIRCVKTQESGKCDRCLRLDKECLFKPARRNHVRQGRSRALEARSRTASKSPLGVFGPSVKESVASISDELPDDPSFNPFISGILPSETGEKLIDYYNNKMTTHYPFVVLPQMQNIEEFARDWPGLCLAALAAAAHDDLPLQGSLNTLFNNFVSLRLLKGSFRSIDMLQGLLVHVAWGHYQTRPKRYTQYLHLATSIISDLRIDQPRRPSLWSIDGGKDRDCADWGIEEMRALAGAYYLSSSTSVLLHKSRHFAYSTYVLRCSEHIAKIARARTDTHLPYLVRLQRLTEEVEDAWSTNPEDVVKQPTEEAVRRITIKCEEIKSSLPFPINESLPILMQFNLLDLFLSQSSPGGSHYGVDKFDRVFLSHSSQQSNLIDWLSASISAAQSLIQVILVLPSGEEAALSNVSWITLYCALSLAVRLDLAAAKTESTQFLRRFLDMDQTLRQTCMRLEAASGKGADGCDERNPFYHLALRARRLEKWYLKQKSEQQGSGADSLAEDSSLSELVPSSLSDGGLDFGMGSVLFSDALGFPIHFQMENAGMWEEDAPGS